MKNYHPSVTKILNIIKENNLWYETFEHEPVTTSQEASKIRTGYTLSQGAKAIILRIKEARHNQKNSNSESSNPKIPNTNHIPAKKYFAQFIVPGDAKINSKKLTKLLKAKSIRFATADEILNLTDGIQIGGIPPFGNIFNLPVYADPTLIENNRIIFNAGDRRFSIALKTKDYLDLVKPKILAFVQ